MSKNAVVVKGLRELSFLLGQAGEKRKSTAFNKAAKAVEQFDGNIEDIEPTSIRFVGGSSGKIIDEIIKTGTSKRIEELKKDSVPSTIVELQKIPGVGPVGALGLHKTYGIKTLDELRTAIEDGTIKDEKIIAGLKYVDSTTEYCPRPWAEEAGENIIKILTPLASLNRNDEPLISFAGSIRRKKDLVRDIDIVIAIAEKSKEEVDKIYELVRSSGYEVKYGGDSKIRIEYEIKGQPRGGDIIVTTEDEWAFAMSYLTGSKEFNIGMRALAKKQGRTLNEKALLDDVSGVAVGSRVGEDVVIIASEEDLFEELEIPYVPPELRRSSSDVGRDFSHIIPSDTHPNGELHIHSKFSDGNNSIKEIVDSACDYVFVGISDHTSAMPRGVSEGNVLQYAEEVRLFGAINQATTIVLAGLEVEINAASDLVIPVDILIENLDYVILAIHSAIGKNMIDRYISGIEQVREVSNLPLILAHPTARDFGSRDYNSDDDWNTLFRVCADNNVILEINCVASRLDLPNELIGRAKSAGCKFILSSDSHHLIGDLSEGISKCRAAELTVDDVLLSYRDIFVNV